MHPCNHAPDSPTCIEGAVLGMNLGASEAAMQLRIVLHGWSRIFDEESPIVVDPDLEQPEADARRCTARRERDRALAKSGTQALLLADQALAGRVWAPDLAAEIRDAVRQAERVIDRPPDLTLIGACACGMSIYAAEGETTIRCRWCGTRHDTLDLHARALAGAHDALESATVIARAIVDPVTRKPVVSASQIRGWKHRGALDVAGVNGRGQPLYRVADVERLIRDGAELSSDVT